VLNPGLEDEVDQFGAGKTIGVDADLAAPAGDVVFVQTAAVIGEADDDAAGVASGGDTNRCGSRLTAPEADLRQFDAVIDRVADHVRKRILELLDDRRIDFDVAGLDEQRHALLLHCGDIAHDAVKETQRRPERNEPRPHDHLLQIEAEAIELSK